MVQSNDLGSVYLEAFRKDVHQLIAWGYEDSRHKFMPSHEEEDITGFIAQAIDDRLDDPSTPDRWSRYTVHEEIRVSGSGRTGKSRKRIDITFRENLTIKPRPEFSIEAKRLKKGTHPISKYTGEEGLMCFVNGEYASRSSEAGMVGYMQSNDAGYWFGQLSRKFRQDKCNGMACTKKLGPVRVLGTIPDERVSEHKRPDNSTISIYHILLKCY